MRKYYQNNKKYQRKYYQNNREKVLIRTQTWKINNPERRKQHAHNYNARKRGAKVGHVDYIFITIRDRMVCYLCERKIKRKDLSFDHVVPLSRGGKHSNDNIRSTHLACNLAKGSSVLLDAS